MSDGEKMSEPSFPMSFYITLPDGKNLGIDAVVPQRLFTEPQANFEELCKEHLKLGWLLISVNLAAMQSRPQVYGAQADTKDSECKSN